MTDNKRRNKKIMQKKRFQQGQAIVIVAFAMIGLLAFMVLAIDGSRYYDQRRITQNAGDVSALAGLHAWFNEPGASNNKAVRAKIIHIAEINGIPDTDGVHSSGSVSGNVVNANVEAYWVNANGDYVTNPAMTTVSGGCGATVVVVSRTTEPPPQCALIDDQAYGMPTGSTTAANNGAGIRVRVRLPYISFIGQMIGWRNMQAQADSTALHISTPVTIPPNQSKQAVWSGGGADCMDSTHPALYLNSNNADVSNAMVNGGFYTDSTNQVNNQYAGTVTSVGSANNPPNLDTSNSANQFLQGGQYAPEHQYNDWAYFTDDDQPGVVNVLKQAILFKPDNRSTTVDTPNYPVAITNAPAGAANIPVADNTTLPNNYAFREWYNHRVNDPINTPDNFYHYIKYANTADNYKGLRAMIDAGKRGVFYVDGDLVITNHDAGTPNFVDYNSVANYGVTIIASGRITIDGASNTVYGNAGKWGHGISFLAGGYPDPAQGESPCAIDADDAIFTLQSQRTTWRGIIFVPNGLAALNGNYDNSGATHYALMAYSIGIGLPGHPANNPAFAPCPDCWIQPDTSTLNLSS